MNDGATILAVTCLRHFAAQRAANRMDAKSEEEACSEEEKGSEKDEEQDECVRRRKTAMRSINVNVKDMCSHLARKPVLAS